MMIKIDRKKKKQYGGLVKGDSSRFSHQNKVKENTKENYFLGI